MIENDVYRIVFTNRGARVKSWVLKKYTDDKGGQLELVNTAAAEKYGYPLTLWSYDEGLRNQVNSALYVGSSQFSVLSSQKTGSVIRAFLLLHKKLSLCIPTATFPWRRASRSIRTVMWLG